MMLAMGCEVRPGGDSNGTAALCRERGSGAREVMGSSGKGQQRAKGQQQGLSTGTVRRQWHGLRKRRSKVRDSGLCCYLIGSSGL
jgi:hypothetical protein